MEILLITPYYSPDIGPSAPLFTLLCEQLAKMGHQVTVLAAVPHYPSGLVQKKFRGQWIKHSIENEVNLIRVAVPSLDRKKFFFRLIQFVSYQINASLALIGKKFDVALVTNPGLETWLPFFFLKTFTRKPIIFSIHDVYPDVGIRLGIFRSKAVVSIITALEQYCLKYSTKVRTLSDSFLPAMRRLGVEDSKIDLIHDWVDTDLIHPLPKDNDFSVENKLSGKFVVLYAGNIGLSQGLEHVLVAANKLKEQTDILFVFVGGGSALESLQQTAVQMDLSNIRFIPFQPRERLPQVLASASVSLVILNHGVGNDSLPSKTFSILASGRPILASVDEESEVSKLVQRAQAGVCISPEDPEKLSSAILALKNDGSQRKQLGANGRKYAEEHHSVSSAAVNFEQLFKSVLKNSHPIKGNSK